MMNNEMEVKTIFSLDYSYVPFINESKLNIRENRKVYKEDIIYDDENKIYSPISGVVHDFGEINTFNGTSQVVIIENDFKDSLESKNICLHDIYEAKSEDIKNVWKPKCSKIYLNLVPNSLNDLKDEYILIDNINIILKTLDLLDQTYPDISVSILLSKKQIKVYQLLFANIGTYPNIEMEFDSSDDACLLSTYEVLDIYNNIKKCNKRDYIYLTFINDKDFMIIKTKKYTNLKDLLSELDINATGAIINEKIKLSGTNFLLDESINVVNVN